MCSLYVIAANELWVEIKRRWKENKPKLGAAPVVTSLKTDKVVHALPDEQCNRCMREIFSLAVTKGGAQCTAYL